jgi:type IV pilus assembly protein PilC
VARPRDDRQNTRFANGSHNLSNVCRAPHRAIAGNRADLRLCSDRRRVGVALRTSAVRAGDPVDGSLGVRHFVKTNFMAQFRYQALDVEGRSLSGEIAADNVQQAISILEAKNLTIQSIGLQSLEPAESPILHTDLQSETDASLDSVDQVILQPQVNRVLEKGKALIPALWAIREETPPGRHRRQIDAVCQVLEQGDANVAIQAIRSSPDYWIPLLGAALSCDDSGRVLGEFLDESQLAEQLSRQWRRALIYPLIVMCLIGFVLTVFSLLIVPVFRGIFYDFEVKIPSLTMLVLTVAESIQNGSVLIFLVLFAVVIAIALNARRWMPESLRNWLGDYLPWPFGRSTSLARFTRFTADLLEAGMSIPDSLQIAGTLINGRVGRAAQRLANAVKSGGKQWLAPRKPMTTTILYALQSEIPTKSRVDLLREISLIYADRARSQLSWTRAIVEPVSIALIGVLVGGVVIALFLPLVVLVESLT